MEAIKIGDAACAIDPLSSQGVQVALGSAIQAAAVINTILHRPADAPSAIDFYHQRQQQTRKVHASAATQFYQEALPTYDGKFWQRRAIMPNLPSTTTTPTQTVNILANELNLANYPTTAYPITNDQTNHSNHFANSLLPTTKLQLNPAVKFLAVPTLQEHWIVPAIGISGHTLPTPVVYLGGIAIAELLTHLPPIITVAQVLQHWSTQLSAMQSLAILNWLGQRDILSIIN
jgi:hypothetical protein